MGPRKRHILARNETTRIPAVVLTLVTAPGTRPLPPGSDQPVFQWALTDNEITSGDTFSDSRHTYHGTDRDQLAGLIDSLVRSGKRTWLYAHGLAVHLSAAGLLDRLSVAGWTPVRNALDGPAPSVELADGHSTRPGHSRAAGAYQWHDQAGIPLKDCRKHPELNCPYRGESNHWDRRLIIADAAAVWPRTTIDDIGADLSIRHPLVPASSNTAGWTDLITRDALVLSDALSTALHWWETNDAGNWGKTGASTGWNAMRHRMSKETTVIDVSHPATRLERAACYGGRRSLFRFGQAPPGTYEELDFYRAYTVVARDLRLPTGRRASFANLPLDHITVAGSTDVVGLIAEVTISDAGGRYPVRMGKRVWYPCGRITTILAGPEIREALRLGILEKIGAGQWYTLGRTMSPWARWCLSEQENPATPKVVVRMLKHHGRAVIGKTAGHAYAHQDLGPAWHHGFRAEQTVVGPQRIPGWVVDLGGRRILSYPDGEADESFPAILAYVESHVRVRLSRIIDTVGDQVAVQADTDGLIISVDALRHAPLPALPDVASPGMPFRPGQVIDALNTLVAPLSVREKALVKSFTAVGPQHYQAGPIRKRAGVPGNAKPDRHGNLTGVTYPRLMEQASKGQPDTYTPLPWSGKNPVCTAARWVLDTGRTVAPQAELNDQGVTCLIPWERTVYHRAGLVLGPIQDPVLTELAGQPVKEPNETLFLEGTCYELSHSQCHHRNRYTRLVRIGVHVCQRRPLGNRPKNTQRTRTRPRQTGRYHRAP